VYIIAPGGGGIDETELLMQINNTSFDSNITESSWWAKSSAYSVLKLQDTIIIQNSELITFKDSVDLAVLGKFTEIDKSIIDTLGANIDSLKSVNSAISTNNAIEELIKAINAIKFDFEKYHSLSDAQLNSLKIIAAMCPHTEGPAVYTGRALLRGLDKNRGEYMNECEKVYPSSSANRQSQNSSIETNIYQSNFSVFPNPASTSIVLNHNGSFTKISIEEISGKIVFAANLKTDLSSEIFDVSNLANGIYLIKMQGDSKSKQLKLVINK
jgi:hypothetical protein